MSRTESERLPVVYLAGSGHTGSTLLALFLDAHPRIVSVGETAFKRKIQRRGSAKLACTCGASYLDCPFWQAVFRGVTEAGFEFSPLKWSNDFRYKNPLAHRLLSRYSGNPALRAMQRAAAALLPGHGASVDHVRRVNVEFIRTVLRVAHADVFFDTSKRAMRLYHLLETSELDVKVVKLVRDVRGYVSSAKKRGASVSDAALAWRTDQENFEHITRDLPSDRVMLLRYEDACRDPQTWLKRTYAFCGVEPIDPPEVVVSGEHHVLGNNMRRNEKIRIRLDESWRSLLSSDEQARALAIAGPFQGHLGYAEP
jgi:hypothetical protein